MSGLKGQLNNHNQGLIATPGALLLNNLGTVNNGAGGEISSSQSFPLKASQLNNSAGRAISGQDLQLQITQALLNNLKGVLSAAKLTVSTATPFSLKVLSRYERRRMPHNLAIGAPKPPSRVSVVPLWSRLGAAPHPAFAPGLIWIMAD